MSQSTEDYLDSLLRQAMGIPEPEPEQQEMVDSDELQNDSSQGADDLDELQLNDGVQDISLNDGDDQHDVDGTFFSSDKVSDFFADDTPFSDDFVYPEEALRTDRGVDIPPDMQLDDMGRMMLDDSYVPEAEQNDNDDLIQNTESVDEDKRVEDTSDSDGISMSIEDLDPNDANKALDPDMIAALFAGANAEADSVPTGTGEAEANIEDSTENINVDNFSQIDSSEDIATDNIEEETPGTGSISIDDLDPNDANKALDPDMIAALFASANAETDNTSGEANAEEAIAEEVTEDVSEETPGTGSISIDDLDPNDANKALDPDMIAALFASANAETDNNSGEEKAEEASEEEITEDSSGEESDAGSISIDDLDPNDANKALDPDMIAALFASANADADSVSQDEEASADNEMRADEEISELLSNLDGADSADDVNQDNSAFDVGGLDLSDVDLGAMLDDVNSQVEADSDNSVSSDDFSADDLNALLNSMEGDDDLSDIGDLLSKDENSEIISPDLSASEALFGEPSLSDMFNFEDSDEDDSKSKKKKEKKKKKKKKSKDEFSDFESDGEELFIDPTQFDFGSDDQSGNNDSKKKAGEKEPGFFARLFAKLFEEIDEDEATSGNVIEQSAVDIAIEGAEVNESILKEESEAAPKKKEKKSKKDKKKKGEVQIGEDGEEIPVEPKKKKKEKKKKEEEPEVPSKKLPIKKVIAIFALCISIGFIIVAVTIFIPYASDMKNAEVYYSVGDYRGTYESLMGHDLNEKEQELYDKSFTMLKVQRFYDSYITYMKMGFKLEALNALVQGVQVMDVFGPKAIELGIGDKFFSICNMITDELQNTFGVSVDQARQWYLMEGTPEYTKAIYDHIFYMQPRDEDGNPIYEPESGNKEVITAEENDL